jgi:NDP-sugar pyrophosphorylase family protein
MTVFENREKYDSSNVWFEGGGSGPTTRGRSYPPCATSTTGSASFGAGLRPFPEGRSVDLADVQKALLARGELAGFEVAQRFYEIGSHAGLSELDHLLKNQS